MLGHDALGVLVLLVLPMLLRCVGGCISHEYCTLVYESTFALHHINVWCAHLHCDIAHMKLSSPQHPPPADGQGDHQDAASGKTVFVRNVPYTMDASALEQLFASDVGPVRNAFLVSRKGNAQHAGYGYVQFALPQDAMRATQLFATKRVQGRKLQVSGMLAPQVPQTQPPKQVMHARRRAPLEERKRKRTDPAATTTALEKPRAPKRPCAPSAEASALLRTVAVSAPAPIDSTLLQHIRKLVAPLRIASMTDPVPADIALRCRLREDGAGQHCALLDMGSVRDALRAVASLHRASVPGGHLWARQAGGEALHRKKARLIVRNLPFGVAEQELITLASTVAFPWEVTLPRDAQGVWTAGPSIDVVHTQLHRQTTGLCVSWVYEPRACAASNRCPQRQTRGWASCRCRLGHNQAAAPGTGNP